MRVGLFAKTFLGPAVAAVLGMLVFAKSVHLAYGDVDLLPLLASMALIAIGAGALCWSWRCLWERARVRRDDDSIA